MKEAFSTPRCLHVVQLGSNMGICGLLFKTTQQEATGGPKVLATTPWRKTAIQVVETDRGAKAHHRKQVLCPFEPSSPLCGRFSVQKWPFWRCFSGHLS